MGVGMPQWILLNRFGKLVKDAFGEYPYLVGSAVEGKQWRDVDVRLILEDDVYAAMFGSPKDEATNKKWLALCLAFALLGKEMTGLPIDFQIQQQSDANAKYPGKHRSSLILYDEVFDKKDRA